MDQLEREELKNSIESVLSTLQCPVCLGLLEKDLVLCVYGHAICKKCHSPKSVCPKCRSSFSNLTQNTVLLQILEMLPHCCRFDRCSHLVKSGDDHETFCCFRPTNCHLPNCTWIGSADNLKFHMEDKHPKTKILSGTKHMVKVAKSYVEGNGVLLFSSGGHYFWKKFFVDHNQSVITFLFTPVFMGKPTSDVYLRAWFRSDEREYDTGMRFKMNQNNAAGSSFLLPLSMITTFYNENELKYHLMITEVRSDAVNLMME